MEFLLSGVFGFLLGMGHMIFVVHPKTKRSKEGVISEKEEPNRTWMKKISDKPEYDIWWNIPYFWREGLEEHARAYNYTKEKKAEDLLLMFSEVYDLSKYFSGEVYRTSLITNFSLGSERIVDCGDGQTIELYAKTRDGEEIGYAKIKFKKYFEHQEIVLSYLENAPGGIIRITFYPCAVKKSHAELDDRKLARLYGYTGVDSKDEDYPFQWGECALYRKKMWPPFEHPFRSENRVWNSISEQSVSLKMAEELSKNRYLTLVGNLFEGTPLGEDIDIPYNARTFIVQFLSSSPVIEWFDLTDISHAQVGKWIYALIPEKRFEEARENALSKCVEQLYPENPKIKEYATLCRLLDPHHPVGLAYDAHFNSNRTFIRFVLARALLRGKNKEEKEESDRLLIQTLQELGYSNLDEHLEKHKGMKERQNSKD